MWIWTFGCDFEAVEGFLDHAPGGIALGVVGFGAGNAAVIGGDFDRRLGGSTRGNCHKIMQLEGLVDGGEGVESVRAGGPTARPRFILQKERTRVDIRRPPAAGGLDAARFRRNSARFECGIAGFRVANRLL